MCSGRFKPIIAFDGCIPADFISAVGRIIPDCRVVSAKAVIRRAFSLTPRLKVFLDHHQMGVKLLLPMLIQQTQDVLYADNDVICFRDIGMEISSSLCPRYIQEQGEACYDTEVVKRVWGLKQRTVARLNGGLHWIPKSSLDIDLADELLADRSEKPVQSWFTEQTVNACLFAAACGRPFAQYKFIVSGNGQFFWQGATDLNDACVRHYTSTVRHRLYIEAYPKLLSLV